MGDVPAGLQPIIAQLKGELKRRGAVGIIGLSRRFRAADLEGELDLLRVLQPRVALPKTLRVLATMLPSWRTQTREMRGRTCRSVERSAM